MIVVYSFKFFLYSALTLYFIDFDIKFSEAKQKIEMYPPVTDQKSFSLSTWIAVPKNLANFSLFRSESSIINIDVNYMEFLNIRINRYDCFVEEAV